MGAQVGLKRRAGIQTGLGHQRCEKEQGQHLGQQGKVIFWKESRKLARKLPQQRVGQIVVASIESHRSRDGEWLGGVKLGRGTRT